MKKVLLLLSFLVAFFVSNAQYPIIQFLGRDSSLVDSRGGLKARLINYPFTDTTEANAQRISQYAGAMIYTTSGGDKLWLRNSTATQWVRVGSGSGSGISLLGVSDYGLIIQNDSTYKADTIQLSTRLWRQKGVDSVQGNVNLKLNISDTANIKPRLYAGTNVTITGTYPNLTIASSGGGATDTSTFVVDTLYNRLATAVSVDTLLLKSIRLKLNGTDISPTSTDSTLSWDILASVGGSQTLQQTTDLGDSTTGRIVTNDSLKAQDAYIHGSAYLGDTLYNRGDSLIAFGSSITAGSGVSTSQRFSYLLAQAYGMIEANFGGGGNTIDAVYTALYKIPTKTSNRGFLLFEYNMNDCTTSDTTTWKTKANVIIDTAVARGWTLNKIGFVGGPYSNASARVNLPNWVRATQTVCETRGVKFFDAYTFMQTRGGVALTQDSVHPNALGHAVMFQAANTAFLEFKKKGLVDVTGDVIARRRLFAGTPLATGSYPANAVGVFNGRVHFYESVIEGGDTSRIGNSIHSIRTSSGQVGLAVNQTGTSSNVSLYGDEIDIFNSSGQALKIYATSMTVGNGDLKFTGHAGRNIFSMSTYGGAVFNEDGNTDNFRIEGDAQTHLLYTDGTNDRVGIRTSTPDSNFTVNGSVHFMSTARYSGIPSSTDSTTYKPFAISSSGSIVKMASWPVGLSGGGTTYKIGTLNGTTPNGNGAVIISDSIFMQTFTSELAGLVPAGGSSSTFLRGDGTWATLPGGTGYVDSVSNNAGGDSLIVFKGSNRYAYKYPAGSTGWGLTGNNPASGWTEGSFLGTTTNKSLLIRTNNILRARIDSAGAAGIFRLYPATRTDQYLDYGTTANNWTMYGSGIALTATGGAVNVSSAGTNTAAFYNGELVVGSVSATGTTKLRIDNANTTKSVMNWSSTTKKTTAADGDWTRDANGVYYGKSTTWNELLMTASVNTVSPTAPDRTITVVVGGVTYYIHAKTTND